jgi:hypothetical protein
MRYIRAMPHSNDNWSIRHSVQATARRTAALVNALANENPTAGAVAELLREHGEIGSIELSVGDIAEMRAAAVMLRDVFAAEHVDLAASRLNHLLQQSAGMFRLTSHHGLTPWHPHLDNDDDAPWGEWLLASSCLAMTVLIWDHQRPPGGLCASASCQNVYITQGSGPPRRYCSRRCATRERVAAHRRSRA